VRQFRSKKEYDIVADHQTVTYNIDGRLFCPTLP
jgi:hypothetical protein